MNTIEIQIKEMANSETQAWNTQDVELLMTFFILARFALPKGF